MKATIATCALLTTLVGTIAAPASAQERVFRMNFSFDGLVDCSRPIAVRDFALRGSGSAVLYSDRRATLAYTQHAVSATQVRFDAKLGATPMPAPGGTASLRVVNRNKLRAVWSLPNNDIVMNILVAGNNTCSVQIDNRLRRGAREFTLYYGGDLAYCQKPRISRVNCQAI